MPSYNFQIKLSDRIVLSLDNVTLTEPTEAWEVISELATRFHTPGHRVLVKDEQGRVVIMAGLMGASALETITAA